MRNLTQENITQAVIARLAHTPDERLREVMTSLVQHLHAFARDVQLTEAEWDLGIRFLTDVGHKSDDKRQEFVLLSDTLGLSMLTVAMNNDKPPGCTEATVFGPFHVEGAPRYRDGADIANGAVGEPCQVRGRVVARDGRELANARVEVWQADASGNYDLQYEGLDRHRARGVLHAGPDGRSISARCWPSRTRSPADGPVGPCCGPPPGIPGGRPTCIS